MLAASLTVSVALVAVIEEVTCVAAKLKLRRSIVSCPVIPATVPLKVVESSSSGSVRSFVYGASVKGEFGYRSSKMRHQRHGGQVCLAAPSGQVPKPRSGAPQARDLTAK